MFYFTFKQVIGGLFFILPSINCYEEVYNNYDYNLNINKDNNENEKYVSVVENYGYEANNKYNYVDGISTMGKMRPAWQESLNYHGGEVEDINETRYNKQIFKRQAHQALISITQGLCRCFRSIINMILRLFGINLPTSLLEIGSTMGSGLLNSIFHLPGSSSTGILGLGSLLGFLRPPSTPGSPSSSPSILSSLFGLLSPPPPSPGSPPSNPVGSIFGTLGSLFNTGFSLPGVRAEINVQPPQVHIQQQNPPIGLNVNPQRTHLYRDDNVNVNINPAQTSLRTLLPFKLNIPKMGLINNLNKNTMTSSMPNINANGNAKGRINGNNGNVLGGVLKLPFNIGANGITVNKIPTGLQPLMGLHRKIGKIVGLNKQIMGGVRGAGGRGGGGGGPGNVLGLVKNVLGGLGKRNINDKSDFKTTNNKIGYSDSYPDYLEIRGSKQDEEQNG